MHLIDNKAETFCIKKMAQGLIFPGCITMVIKFKFLTKE